MYLNGFYGFNCNRTIKNTTYGGLLRDIVLTDNCPLTSNVIVILKNVQKQLVWTIDIIPFRDISANMKVKLDIKLVSIVIVISQPVKFQEKYKSFIMHWKIIYSSKYDWHYRMFLNEVSFYCNFLFYLQVIEPAFSFRYISDIMISC